MVPGQDRGRAPGLTRRRRLAIHRPPRQEADPGHRHRHRPPPRRRKVRAIRREALHRPAIHRRRIRHRALHRRGRQHLPPGVDLVPQMEIQIGLILIQIILKKIHRGHRRFPMKGDRSVLLKIDQMT